MGRKSRKKRGLPPAAQTLPASASVATETTLWPKGLVFNFGFLLVVSAILFRRVFLHPDQMLWGSDIERLHSGFKFIQHRAFREFGHFPLWDPTMLCGRSIVGDASQTVLNPLGWLFWVTSAPLAFGVYFWLYVTAGAWGVVLWMRLKGAEPVAAMLAAVSFAFSGKVAGYVFAGHMDMLPAMLCAPWVFWAAERILVHRSIGSAVVLGGVLSVAVSMGHLPTLYWHVVLAGVYVAIHGGLLGAELGWATLRRPIGLFLLAGVVFLLGAMASWLPVVRQTLLLSARSNEAGGGYAFSTMCSAAPTDLLRFLWPFHGMAPPKPFASDPENNFFWETASYPGLVALAMACFLVVVAPKNRTTVIFGSLALVTTLLALGPNTPLYGIFYDVVPGVSLQRAPGRLLIYSNLFFSCMAGFGLGELLRGGPRRRWSLVTVVSGLFIVAVAGSADAPALESLAGGPALALLVLGAIGVVAVQYARERISTVTFAASLIAVSLLDLGVVWSTHIYTAPPEQVLPSNSVVDFLESRRAAGPFRYYDPTETVPQQLAARHGLETITGYNPGIYQHQLELYRALWPLGEQSDLVQLLMHSPHDVACTNVLDLMNVRYVVAYESVLDDRFRKVFTSPAGEFRQPRNVFERVDALPRAFVVSKSVPAGTIVDDVKAVCRLSVREACIMNGGPADGSAAFQALVSEEKSPGDIELAFETQAPGVLVISESWHPDWLASDNSVPVTVHCANCGFLSIPLATGPHSVRLWYQPWDFYLGCAVSSAFWLIVGAILLLTRKSRNHAGAAPRLPTP